MAKQMSKLHNENTKFAIHVIIVAYIVLILFACFVINYWLMEEFMVVW